MNYELRTNRVMDTPFFGYNRTRSQIGGLKKKNLTLGRQVYIPSDVVLVLRDISDNDIAHLTDVEFNALSYLIRKLNREV